MDLQYPLHINGGGGGDEATQGPSSRSFRLSIYLSMYTYSQTHTYISIYLSICLSLSVYLLIHLPIYLDLCLSIDLYLSIYIYLSISISLYIFLSIYVYLYLYPLPPLRQSCSTRCTSMAAVAATKRRRGPARDRPAQCRRDSRCNKESDLVLARYSFTSRLLCTNQPSLDSPAHLHFPPWCNSSARPLGSMQPPSDLPFVCHAIHHPILVIG